MQEPSGHRRRSVGLKVPSLMAAESSAPPCAPSAFFSSSRIRSISAPIGKLSSALRRFSGVRGRNTRFTTAVTDSSLW